MRDRSNEGLDIVDRFATGPHCRVLIRDTPIETNYFSQMDRSSLRSFSVSLAPS